MIKLAHISGTDFPFEEDLAPDPPDPVPHKKNFCNIETFTTENG